MKKKNLLKGFCAKLALATVGLVTTMFTSCSNEDIQIAVKPVNAKAIINPVVIIDGIVNSTAAITFSEGNGTYEGNPSLTAKSITITATYNDLTGSVIVNIPSLTAGQSWSQSAVITLNHGIEFYDVITINTEELEKKTTEKFYDNPSNYWYNIPVTYKQVYTSKVINNESYSIVEGLEELIEKYNFDESVSMTEEYPVYAQSRLVVKQDIITTQTIYKVKNKANQTIVATFTVEEKKSAILTNSNAQIPGHNHNPNGHGHGHGENAGGGIIFAD